MSRSVMRKPGDKPSAKEVMKKFSDMAYSLSHLPIFEEAVHILYGREFDITLDLSKRMQFSCKICNREMNSENAMAEHFRSGGHQKNLDKRSRELGELSIVPRARDYAIDSMQSKLLSSHMAPVGLQMVEEYINRRGNTYYKCIICGAHGKLDIMYHHIVNKKHTEKYIKSACILENSILTPNEREEIRKKLIHREGVNVDAIKTIRGNEFYPYKWEKEGVTSKNYNLKIKKERRSSSSSPPPDRYHDRSRSSSSSMSQESHRYKRSRSRSRGRRSRSVTPKWRRYSRSPPLRRSRTPSWRRSRSPSRRHSRSPTTSYGYSRKSHRSPVRSRRDYSSNSRSPEPCRKHRSFGSISSSEGKSSKRIKMEKVSMERSPPPRLPSSQAMDIQKQLDSFRNRSPPPVRIKSEPLSPLKNAYAASSSLNIKTEPGIHPGGTGFNETSLPLSLASVKKEVVDEYTQTVDLEPLMKKLVEYTKRSDKHPLRRGEDVKDAIELMGIIAGALRELTISQFKDDSFKTPERKDFLLAQKEKREKIIGYCTKWYMPTWEKEVKGKY